MGISFVLALTATPAFAERTKVSAITEANGSPFGQLSLTTCGCGIPSGGVAVDGSDNLWVGDPVGQVVDKFSSSGSFLTQSFGGWSGQYPGPVAFSNASEHLYLGDWLAGDIWGLEPNGTYASIDLTGPWDAGCCVGLGIAADNSIVSGAGGGDLYITGEGATVYRIDGAGTVQPFSAKEPYVSENKLTGFAAGEAFFGPVAVAVDSAGNVYVADAGRDAVYEFESSGKFKQSFTEAGGSPFGSISAVAVDPTNGHLLVADSTNDVVDEFDSTTGAYLDNVIEVGEGVGGPASLAVDSTGKLYVTEGDQVAVYGPYGPHAPRLPKLLNGVVSGVGLTSATLNATVKPNGEEVSECRFEYGTREAFGQSVPCAPGTFSSTTAVAGQLSGLTPDTAYLYRLHVVDPGTGPAGVSGPVDGFRTFSPNPVPAGPPASGCPNEAARQGLSALLPDCRAYEQVTPVDKGVAEDMFNQEEGSKIASYGFPSEAGNQFLLATPAAIGEKAVAQENGYVFSRAASGWSMTSLAAPGLGLQSIPSIDHVFNPVDLSQVGFGAHLGTVAENEGPEGRDALVAGAPGGPYGPPGGPYGPVGPYEPMNVPANGAPELAGATGDLDHVIIESKSHNLAPGATEQAPGSNALYEWSGGHVSLVNVNSDGSLVGSCGATLGRGVEEGGAHGAVSSDGSKIFFTAPDPHSAGLEGEPGCWAHGGESHWGVAPEVNPPELYMRVSGSTTVDISVPEPGVKVKDPTPYAAVYVGASADGSRVFFLSHGELTADDPGHATELYEYDTLTSKLTRVSSGDSGIAVGNVAFVAAVSSDGSTVYFGANGRLAPGAPAGGGLYRYDTLTKQTIYITGGANYPDGYGDERTNSWEKFALVGTGQGAGLDDRANWYATADGQYLVFPSGEPITGYDCGGSGGNCSELYRYDAADNSIVCVSCGGPPPVDSALFARAGTSVGPQSLSPRPISEDGGRVFFDTADPLVPGASAGQTHVYEWHEGVISLLSPPHDPHGSFFLGTSADGGNVFIGTHAQLVAQDTDTAGDLYDARIGGGFAEVAAPACTGTGCQGVPPAPPIFATPSSTTFEGPGNFPAGSGGSIKPKTNAQRLAEAMKVCKKRYRNAHRRAQCDARARKRYPVAHKYSGHKSTRGGK